MCFVIHSSFRHFLKAFAQQFRLALPLLRDQSRTRFELYLAGSNKECRSQSKCRPKEYERTEEYRNDKGLEMIYKEMMGR